MPPTQVNFYVDERGTATALVWLKHLPLKPRAKGFALIKLLSELGYELRRPHCDLLRDGIYALRWRWRKTQYRLLYFYRGKHDIVISHGFTKEGVVPSAEIDKAVRIKGRI